MALHQVLAKNLRRHCDRHSSIAQVCRGAQINRQQFNKYLAGQIIPNARTLDRLCRYLGIDEHELFRPDDGPAGVPAGRADPSNQSLAEVLAQFSHGLRAATNRRALRPAEDMPDGYYYCYFLKQGSENELVRAMLKIKTQGELTTFTRRTVFRSSTTPGLTVTSARHSGLAIATRGEIYLLGVNQSEPHNLSLMIIETRQVTTSNIFTGMALTRALSSPHASRVCLEYLGSSMAIARKHLPRTGFLAPGTTDVNPHVTAAMLLHQQMHGASTGSSHNGAEIAGLGGDPSTHLKTGPS